MILNYIILYDMILYDMILYYIILHLQVLGDSGAMDALKASMEEKFMANNPSKVLFCSCSFYLDPNTNFNLKCKHTEYSRKVFFHYVHANDELFFINFGCSVEIFINSFSFLSHIRH